MFFVFSFTWNCPGENSFRDSAYQYFLHNHLTCLIRKQKMGFILRWRFLISNYNINLNFRNCVVSSYGVDTSKMGLFKSVLAFWPSNELAKHEATDQNVAPPILCLSLENIVCVVRIKAGFQHFCIWWMCSICLFSEKC